MPTTVANPMSLDLTADYLVSLGYAPIIAGDTIDLRFQVRDESDAAVSLTSATIVHSWRTRETDAEAVFQLKSTTGGVVLDADQTTENVAAGTGKGWYQLQFRPANEAALTAAAPVKYYDTRIKFGDGSVRTHVRGRVGILRARTENGEIP